MRPSLARASRDRHTKGPRFRLFISTAVLNEIKRGAPEVASRRLQCVESIPILAIDQPASTLARLLLESHAVPSNAKTDALHIAVAAVNRMTYLLTWNCKHIANAERREAIAAVAQQSGFGIPIICTPEQLMGTNDAER